MTDTSKDFHLLQQRYNSMCEGVVAQQTRITDLEQQNRFLSTENLRLGRELKAAQANAQLLGDELNEGNQAANREVERLRQLLKENGIDPRG